MKHKFAYFLFLLSLLFFFCAPAQAKVYWVGRNIDISPSVDENKDRTMMKSMGHSYLIIVPDNPGKLKGRYPEFARLERDLGCGRKGIVIGAYPNRRIRMVKQFGRQFGSHYKRLKRVCSYKGLFLRL